MEPGGDAALAAGAGGDLEHPAHAVGPADGQLGTVVLIRVDGEALQDVGAFERRQDVGQGGAHELLSGPAQDHGERRVGEDHPSVQVDLEDAVRRVLDDMLVVGTALLFTAYDRLPVAPRHGVDETVHGWQYACQEKREGQAPVAAPLFGNLHRRLHDKVAGDTEHHEKLRERRSRRRRGGAHLLQVTDQRLVDLLTLPGDGEDGLEAVAGLLDEALALGRAPRRGLGERRGEDVERPPRHLLGPAVEGGEQGLGVGGPALGVEEVAGAAVGVPGDEGLEVADGEPKAVGTLGGRGQVPGIDQRIHPGGGEVEQRRGLVEADHPRFPYSITHGCAASGGCP